MAYSGVLDDVRTCSDRSLLVGQPRLTTTIQAKQALPLQLKEISLQ